MVLLGVLARDTYAAEESAGSPAFKHARAAWDRHSFEVAEPLYREALEKGGLAPAEVLEGYVRLGSIRAILGKKDSAIAAFRAASILDASFPVPTEAGAKGATLAARAKKDTAKIGSIQLAVMAPKETPSGKSFTVTATLDKPHLPIVQRVGLLAKDGTTGKELLLETVPEESMEFEVSSEIALPGASILVRVDALDGQRNRLFSAEERIHVLDGEKSAAAEAPSSNSKQSGGSSKHLSSTKAGDSGVRKGNAFWSSPWPYVIGGVALAGVGAALFFGTRPVENVSVGSVGVRPQ